MGEANRGALALWEESSFAVLPVAQQLKRIRFRSDGLVQRTQRGRSQEIRSDRQTPDIVRLGIDAGGPIECEFSYSGSGTSSSAQDLMLEAALQSADWGAIQTNTGTYAAVSGVISVSAGTNPETSISVGQWVRLKNASAVVGYARVTARDTGAHTITVVPALTAATITEIEAGSSIANGTTDRSFSIERSHTDLASVFEQYPGCKFNTVALTLGTGSFNGLSFGVMAAREEHASATMGNGSDTAHSTNEVMNSVDHIHTLLENDAAFGEFATSLSISLTNNMYFRQAIGNLGPIGIGSGSFEVSGSMRVYFDDSTLLAKVENWTKTSLAFVLQDAAGNAYLIHLPAVRLVEGGAPLPGLNQDIYASFSFEAYRDPTLGYTMSITRWDA